MLSLLSLRRRSTLTQSAYSHTTGGSVALSGSGFATSTAYTVCMSGPAAPPTIGCNGATGGFTSTATGSDPSGRHVHRPDGWSGWHVLRTRVHRNDDLRLRRVHLHLSKKREEKKSCKTHFQDLIEASATTTQKAVAIAPEPKRKASGLFEVAIEGPLIGQKIPSDFVVLERYGLFAPFVYATIAENPTKRVPRYFVEEIPLTPEETDLYVKVISALEVEVEAPKDGQDQKKVLLPASTQNCEPLPPNKKGKDTCFMGKASLTMRRGTWLASVLWIR